MSVQYGTLHLRVDVMSPPRPLDNYYPRHYCELRSDCYKPLNHFTFKSKFMSPKLNKNLYEKQFSANTSKLGIEQNNFLINPA